MNSDTMPVMKVSKRLYRLNSRNARKFMSKSVLLAVVSLMLIISTVTVLVRLHNGGLRPTSAKTDKQLNVTVTSNTKPAENSPKTDTTSKNTGSSPYSLPAYDPRNASGNLQPTPDKPPIPKTQKPLSINPSSITIYKNLSGAGNVKDGITEVMVNVSAGDGKAINYPVSTGNLQLTATSFNPRTVWDMTASSSYASIGTTDVKLSAVAVNGSANYIGTLHVTVLPLPTFSIATPGFTVTNHYYDPNFVFWGFSGITYSSGFNAADKPTLSVQNDYGLTFTNLSYTDSAVYCAATTALSQNIGQMTIHMVFQNKYQLISIPAVIYVLNY